MNLTLLGRNAFMFAVVFSCVVIVGGSFLPKTQIHPGELNLLAIATFILFICIVPISLWKLMIGTREDEFILISGLSTIVGYGIVQFFSATGDLSLVAGGMCVISLIILFFLSRTIAQERGEFEKEIKHIRKIFFGQEMIIIAFQGIIAVIFLAITGGF